MNDTTSYNGSLIVLCCLTRRVMLMSRRIVFVTRRLTFMSRRIVFVTHRLTFMSRRIIFVTCRLVFLHADLRLCPAESYSLHTDLHLCPAELYLSGADPAPKSDCSMGWRLVVKNLQLRVWGAVSPPAGPGQSPGGGPGGEAPQKLLEFKYFTTPKISSSCHIFIFVNKYKNLLRLWERSF